ncbi:hypothetical protein G6F58_012748 [Rhizopus delemar]|nr:hypothetical protein G6F58_012748 [Rhizopus delemar]
MTVGKDIKGSTAIQAEVLLFKQSIIPKRFAIQRQVPALTPLKARTWNGIKRGVTSRHRTASMMPWKLVEFIWRRKHADNHWKAMLACFSQVSFTRAGIANQGPLVSLLTTVLEDATGDQGDEEPFIFISDEDSNSESDGNNTSAPTTPVKKLRTA